MRSERQDARRFPSQLDTSIFFSTIPSTIINYYFFYRNAIIVLLRSFLSQNRVVPILLGASACKKARDDGVLLVLSHARSVGSSRSFPCSTPKGAVEEAAQGRGAHPTIEAHRQGWGRLSPRRCSLRSPLSGDSPATLSASALLSSRRR